MIPIKFSGVMLASWSRFHGENGNYVGIKIDVVEGGIQFGLGRVADTLGGVLTFASSETPKVLAGLSSHAIARRQHSEELRRQTDDSGKERSGGVMGEQEPAAVTDGEGEHKTLIESPAIDGDGDATESSPMNADEGPLTRHGMAVELEMEDRPGAGLDEGHVMGPELEMTAEQATELCVRHSEKPDLDMEDQPGAELDGRHAMDTEQEMEDRPGTELDEGHVEETDQMVEDQPGAELHEGHGMEAGLDTAEGQPAELGVGHGMQAVLDMEDQPAPELGVEHNVEAELDMGDLQATKSYEGRGMDTELEVKAKPEAELDERLEQDPVQHVTQMDGGAQLLIEGNQSEMAPQVEESAQLNESAEPITSAHEIRGDSGTDTTSGSKKAICSYIEPPVVEAHQTSDLSEQINTLVSEKLVNKETINQTTHIEGQLVTEPHGAAAEHSPTHSQTTKIFDHTSTPKESNDHGEVKEEPKLEINRTVHMKKQMAMKKSLTRNSMKPQHKRLQHRLAKSKVSQQAWTPDSSHCFCHILGLDEPIPCSPVALQGEGMKSSAKQAGRESLERSPKMHATTGTPEKLHREMLEQGYVTPPRSTQGKH